MLTALALFFFVRRLVSGKGSAERRASEFAAAVASAEERANRDRAERDRLAAAKLTAEGESGRLAASLRQLEERLEKERLVREQLAREKTEAERRLNELGEVLRQNRDRLASAQVHRQQLQSERELRERLAAEKSALEQQAAELAAAARRAVEEAQTERKARQRLAAERLEYEALQAEKARLEQQAVELERVARMAAGKAERERREREQLLAAKTEAERRLAALQRQAPPPAEAPQAAAGLPRLTLGGKDPVPGQPRRRPVAGATFQVDLDLEAIPCEPLRDVLEVQQSINLTQLSLEGFPNQYCSAWIVGLRSGSLTTVRVAFRLSDSRRSLVYLPVREPQGREGYARVLQEALKFLRVTGLEMERLPLGTKPEERRLALDAMPVFLAPAARAEGY